MPTTVVNDLNMYFETLGDGEPLVLIAGLGSDLTTWQFSRLADFTDAGYQCVLFDNRDVGRTACRQPQGPYSIRQCAEDTLGLMDQLALSSVHILGVSMGGAIAQELAIHAGHRVRSLTLVASWAECDLQMKKIVSTWKTIRPRVDPGQYFQIIAPWLFSHHFFQESGLFLALADQASALGEIGHTDGVLRQCDAVLGHSTIGRLDRITAPTLVIVGADDILTPPHHSRFLAESIEGAQLNVVHHAAHAVVWENPRDCTTATIRFLDGIRMNCRV